MNFFRLAFAFSFLVVSAVAQVTTTGFNNAFRPEAPGTLLSHPITNGSEPIGRTTSINYLNGWVIVGAEQPGSRDGSDWLLRVYDIADPANPVRRFPSDFGLAYEGDFWHFGNVGVHAHGTMQWDSLLLPQVMRVQGFGGLVERGGTNGIPLLSQVPIGYDRGSMAGPWEVNALWYNSPDANIDIRQAYLTGSGFVSFNTVASLDHVGQFGGGDWHPMLFGDLLIMARSGVAGHDGVVVYRLEYHNFDDPVRANRSITPHFVGSLDGGFQGYWPNLFSDGTGLYVIGSTTDILIGADITQAADPAGDGSVRVAASLTVPNFTNASYPVYQDNFGFIHNRKVDMTRFLAGDANPIVLTLNETNPPRPPGAPALPGGAIVGVNTSQMSLPLGNLWLTGGYPIPGTNQGLGVWVHQQEPDTAPPQVSYHIPQTNRTNYPRHAPLSFLLHEHSRAGGPRNGIDFTVRPVGEGDVLGAFVPGFLIHDFAGVLTFTPDAGLAADMTYQVDFLSDPGMQIGFRDAAGNYIEPYSFRFATGGGINAAAPPVLNSVTANVYQPAPGQQVTVTVAATGDPVLEYRFNFDGTWSDWDTDNFASHTYAGAGRPRVLVQVRDGHGSIVHGSLRLLVITAPPAGPRPTQSSTLAVGDDAGTRRVWSVNPDANTVTVVNAVTGAKEAEHTVGADPRGIARDSNGRCWVTCHDSDEIRVLNADGSAHATIPLAYGSAPHSIAPSPDGALLYVTMFGSGQVHRYSAVAPLSAPLTVGGLDTPRAIAISADGARVLVTRFISAELHAEVREFNASLAAVRTFTLSSANTLDGGDRAAGVPNYLAGIAISPDGTRAAVVSKQDNTLRGTFFGVGNLTHETTVRAVISFLDLNSNAEIPHSRRDFDNSDSPSAVTYTPLGDMLLVTHQGNNRVVGMDALNLAPLTEQIVQGSMITQPAVIALEVGTGLAPQGVLMDGTSNRLFTQDFMGRSVTVRNAAPLLLQNQTSLPLVATTPAVDTELLSAPVLTGKQIFYNAADPRMSADSYISCATCHIDGGHDGRVWDFTGRGEGLRRTTDLRGRSGLGHGAVHWSGNFDEIQDFEHDIRGPFGGTGFLNLTPQQFAGQHPSPASGKTGLSADLDALAAYVSSLTPEHTPRSPHRNANGTLTAAAVAGQAVFTAQNCATCHSGASFTNNALMDVGTQSALSGSRLGAVLPGIDTPSLHGLHATRVYLHHGQAATLGDVFDYAGGLWLPGAAGEFFGGGTAPFNDDPLQGGGGFNRGYFNGSAAFLGGTDGVSGVRFTNVNGGTGGMARIALRYARQYGGGTAHVSINGAQQTIGVERQFPDNGWQVSGWRWLVIEAALNAGTTNTIEVLRGNGDLFLNGILVANASQLAIAQPHRVVESLPSGDRDNLLAYVRQIDGRDAAGVPLPPPAAPSPQPPGIVSEPADITLAVGNALHFVVAVSGTGPFDFVWRRGVTVVGTNSPELHIASVNAGDAGSYTVEVTNAHGDVTTTPAQVTVNDALSITTTTLPLATVGAAYSTNLAAAGGVGTRNWSIAGGVLPLGMSLSSGGVLSGTVNAPAQAVFTVQVSDSSGSAAQPLQLAVQPVGGFVNDPDLVLHYTFDEGSGTQVWDSATGGNNHATTVNEAHWVPGGRFGGAYGPADAGATISRFFPANQGDLNFVPRGDPFTISVWVRSTFAAGGYRTIIGKDDGQVSGYTQMRLWATNPLTNVQGANGGQFGGQLATAPALNDGQWHLLTMVNFNDAGTWRTRVYYDDGTLFNQFNTGPGGTTPGLLRIGDTTLGGNSWNGQLDDLRIYRRALSQSEVAQLYAPPVGPTVSIAMAPGQQAESARPFAEFDVSFSEAVTGPTVDDFTHSGTHALLMTLVEGTQYRLRIAGYTAGVVSAQLPAARVTAVSDGEPNNASNIAAITYSPPVDDDLAPLSDEFEDAATLADWQRNYLVEGWTGADKLEVWDIDTSRSGHMRLVPYASSWYQPYTGAYAFKNVTGDFVATMRMHAARRNGQPGRPTSTYSLGGIMVRTPRGFTNAAPNPDPGPGVVLPWPPIGYTTPWTPNSENYIFLSYGYADAAIWGNVPNTWYNEVKTTINGVSTLYATQSGIPADTDLVTLQVVRSGNVFVVLRRHGEGGQWIIENRFTRNDMPATLQVGITTYTDWPSASAQDAFHHNRTVNTGGNPDLVADADSLRLRRPPAAITPAALQSLPVTGQGGAPVMLTGTALDDALGDSANTAHQPGESYDDWLRENLSPAQLILPALTAPDADSNGDGLANAMEFALGTVNAIPLALELLGPPEARVARVTTTRNALARGMTLVIESNTSLDPGGWTALATSVDGGEPAGTASINETGDALRTLTVETPTGGQVLFVRARVVMTTGP